MDDVQIVQTVTLWDLLREPSLTLQLPRFALFLFVAIIAVIILDRKRLTIDCTFPTVSILLATGLLGVYCHYALLTSWIFEGIRIYIQPWYYPFCFGGLLLFSALFLRGAIQLARDGRTGNLAVRVVLLLLTLYFAVATILTPSRTNRLIEKAEASGELGPPPESEPESIFVSPMLPFYFHSTP